MILIALGSNLPGSSSTPEANLTGALALMAGQGMRVIKRSRIWVTRPVPASSQPDYRNAAALIETGLGPEELLAALLGIERAFGRQRDVSNRNAARTLDLDILAYNDAVLATPALDLPHPRMAERPFVLLPLQDIAPGWRHPFTGRTVSEMLKSLPDTAGCSPLPDDAI